MSNRLSPIPAAPTANSPGGQTSLSHPADLVKLGVKGPNLTPWAQSHGIDLPPKLYDVLPIGQRGLLARVGGEEIILECPPDDALLAKLEQLLGESNAGVYRIEQQSATIELRGKQANRILTQTCGVNFLREPAERIIYTRLAGTSCGIIPMEENGLRAYRIWIDYTLAPYLWETLAGIVREA